MKVLEKFFDGEEFMLALGSNRGRRFGYISVPKRLYDAVEPGSKLTEDPTGHIVAEIRFVCDDPELRTYTYRVPSSGLLDLPHELVFEISNHVPVTLYFTRGG